jgi:hypothetical protein
VGVSGTQERGQALSLPDALLTIPDDAVDTNFPDPQYENDFAGIVGNAGTDADGFEVLFAEASQILVDGPDFLSSLDVELSAIDAVFSGTIPVFEQDFGDSLAAAITQGDPTFAQYNVHLTGNNPPPQGGGGGGGGTPADGCLQFDFGTVPTTNETGAAVYKHVFGLQNPTGKVVKIIKTTITPAAMVNTFLVNPSIAGKTIAVNATLQVAVFFSPGNTQIGLQQAKLTIQTDAPDPQPCIDLSATGIAGPVPGGGGSGGGGGGGGPVCDEACVRNDSVEAARLAPGSLTWMP